MEHYIERHQKMKHFLHFALLPAAVSAIAAAAILPAPVRAQSQPILLSQSVNFRPPDVTAPDNRQGGTHRGAKLCPAGLSITPLIPESNIGLTLAESPTFFVYVPQTSAEIEFVLLTENGTEIVYETAFKVDKPGIVGVTVPATSDNKKSIEVGKRYEWSFSMVCDPQDRSADVVVQGLVQRIEPQSNLKQDLENTDAMSRLNVYAKNGIWYETLATLAELRRKSPENQTLAAEWTKLLQSQGLDSIAAQPLIQPI